MRCKIRSDRSAADHASPVAGAKQNVMPISSDVVHAIASIDVPIDYRPSNVPIDVRRRDNRARCPPRRASDLRPSGIIRRTGKRGEKYREEGGRGGEKGLKRGKAERPCFGSSFWASDNDFKHFCNQADQVGRIRLGTAQIE